MLRRIGSKSVVLGAGVVLIAAAGCTVDTVVYEPHPRERTVIVEEAPPPGPVVQEEVVTEAPPPVVVEVRPARPAYGYVWVDGAYVRRGGRYYWVKGYWGRPPHGGAIWVPARWEHGDRGYVRIEGHWQ